MTDDTEEYEDGEEPIVVTPDPIAGAESNPGKAVDEEGHTTIIKNVDVINSVYIAYLDEIKIRARELAEEIQGELREYEQSEDTQIHISKDPAAIQLIELHALTLTYFEGIAFQFLRWATEVGDELENVMQTKSALSPDEWQESDLEKRDDNISVLQYVKSLSKYGFFEDNGSIHRVKDDRGEFIHNPRSVMGIRTNQDTYPGKDYFDKVGRPEHLKDENLDDPLLIHLLNCNKALDSTEKMVDDYLPLDESIYNSLTEDK